MIVVAQWIGDKKVVLATFAEDEYDLAVKYMEELDQTNLFIDVVL